MGALLTALYTFRMVFLTFFGEAKQTVHWKPGASMGIPLVALAALSILGGFVELPAPWGNLPLFTRFLSGVLPLPAEVKGGGGTELSLQILTAVVSLAGIYLAYLLYLRQPGFARSIVGSSVGAVLGRYWHDGWDFDCLYERALVAPYTWLAAIGRDDLIDPVYLGISRLLVVSNQWLSQTENGHLRAYAMGIGVGAAIIVWVVMLS